jgi:hypothetical protein
MADVRTITIHLDEIRTRAQALSQVRIKRNMASEEEMRQVMYNLDRSIDECRLAEYALKVEQHNSEQTMSDAGYATDDGQDDDSPLARQMTIFRQYAETFTRRIAAIERVIEERRDLP